MAKANRKRQLGRPRSRWEDNIKIDLKKIGWWQALDLSSIEQGKMAVSCECCNKSSHSENARDFLTV